MLEFNNEKLIIKLNGESVEMDFPSVCQAEVYEKELMNNTGEELESTRRFFEILGMSNEVFNSLRLSWITKIQKELRGSEKK